MFIQIQPSRSHFKDFLWTHHKIMEVSPANLHVTISENVVLLLVCLQIVYIKFSGEDQNSETSL